MIAQFDDVFRRTALGADPFVEPLLREVHEAYAADPSDPARARRSLVDLFEFLSGQSGRTHTNCCAVDRFLMEDPTLTKGTRLPGEFVEFLVNADCLHDTIGSPEVAHNFESTPEQLLEKARKLPSGDSHA